MDGKPINVKSRSFSELKRLFEKRIFAIPDIQREFVWTKKKIINLLDSIKKHYPIGSFLICIIPSHKHKNIREGTALPHFNKNNRHCYLVVDGQQRLSVIYSVIFGNSIKTNRYQYPIESTDICLSQRANKESEFEFYDTNKGEYVKLNDILNGKISGSTSKRRRIKECKKAFEQYSFPFIFLDGFDEKGMKEAFIRLNTGGTNLSTVDKFLAESYHKDTDLRSHINNLMEHDLKGGFQYFDKKHIVKSIAANLGYKDFVGSNLATLAKKIANPREIYHNEYIKKHKKINHAIELAADFLTKKFTDASYIPYPAMVSILSVFYFENNSNEPEKEQLNEILRWFWVTGFTQRYSGQKQRHNQLNDADEMRKLAQNKKHQINLEGNQKSDKTSVHYMLNKIKYYSTRGTLRNTFFCYLLSKVPREFSNGEPISIKEVSSIFNSKNDHHIFPKDLLLKDFYMDDINILGNICFLTFGENIKIKNKPPWVYLNDYKKKKDFKKVLSSHVIPHNECVLSKGDVTEKYEQFLEKREELVKKDLINMIGSKYIE